MKNEYEEIRKTHIAGAICAERNGEEADCPYPSQDDNPQYFRKSAMRNRKLRNAWLDGFRNARPGRY